MNGEIQVFQYSQTQTMDVRMVMQDGEPWWVLADVCQVLELVNPSKVAERLDDDEKNTLTLSEAEILMSLSSMNRVFTVLFSGRTSRKQKPSNGGSHMRSCPLSEGQEVITPVSARHAFLSKPPSSLSRPCRPQHKHFGSLFCG